MFLKKSLLRMLVSLDRWLPIFPKDSLYSFNFKTKQIASLPINERAFGMQYWCELEGANFVSRFNTYLWRNEVGFLLHSLPDWKLLKQIKLPCNSIVCPRYIDGTLHALRKVADENEIFNLTTGEILGHVSEAWFDVFEFKGKTYILSGKEIFLLHFHENGTLSISPYSKIFLSAKTGECSIQEFSDKLYLVARIHENRKSALNCYLKLYTSCNLDDWIDNSALFPVSIFGRNCFSGVGFPTLRIVDNELVLFFAGYWGWHMLLPYTIWSWLKQERAEFQ